MVFYFVKGGKSFSDSFQTRYDSSTTKFTVGLVSDQAVIRDDFVYDIVSFVDTSSSPAGSDPSGVWENSPNYMAYGDFASKTYYFEVKLSITETQGVGGTYHCVLYGGPTLGNMVDQSVVLGANASHQFSFESSGTVSSNPFFRVYAGKVLDTDGDFRINGATNNTSFRGCWS